MLETKQLTNHLNSYLNIYDFNDYCPNGLQIEGKKYISKLAFAVSATKYSITEALKIEADVLIVHHGLFWKFHGTRTLTKSFYNRVAPLIKNDINLLGYHLPLDAHFEVGNAASLIHEMIKHGIQTHDHLPFGDYKGMPTGMRFKFKNPLNPSDLKEKLKIILGHDVIHSSPNDHPIKAMGIITGGANSNWIDCHKYNLDAYLTGEISEHDWHEAKEDNIHFYAGGHNATEQFGIQSLMKYLHNKYQDLNLEYFYIPSENPA